MLRDLGVLPRETTNYVPIILAMTIMEKNAAEYGLKDLELDPALEYDTVETPAPTSLALVSDITEAPAAELAAINPALLKGVAPSGYALHVPKGSGSQFMAAVQLVPPERRADWRMHRVASGENLEDIAKRYRASHDSIMSANKLTSEGVMEGDRLIIPAVRPAERPARTTLAAARGTRRTASTRGQAASASSRRAGRTTARTSAVRSHSVTGSAKATQARVRPVSRSSAKSGAVIRKTAPRAPSAALRPARDSVILASRD
jgi:peptidoglycan lytic transglycosylase D